MKFMNKIDKMTEKPNIFSFIFFFFFFFFFYKHGDVHVIVELLMSQKYAPVPTFC